LQNALDASKISVTQVNHPGNGLADSCLT
jgi:hypothetical protein